MKDLKEIKELELLREKMNTKVVATSLVVFGTVVVVSTICGACEYFYDKGFSEAASLFLGAEECKPQRKWYKDELKEMKEERKKRIKESKKLKK